VEAINDLLPSRGLGDRVVRELNGHHDEGNVLRSVRLGGGDTDLGTGVDVDTRVGLAGEGGLRVSLSPRSRRRFNPTYPDSVDNTQAQSSTLQAVPHGQNRVGSLARLRDKDGDIIPEHGSPAVQEVRSYEISSFLRI
jgi:hypothetical protein